MEKNTNNIYTALVEAQRAIGAVGKDGQNTFDKYQYRTIDDVMNAVHGAFTKAGITAVPRVLEREQTERPSKNGSIMIHTVLTVEYSFYSQDGSHVEAVVIGEGMDRGDKSANKALSSAYKYAMFQTLNIPTQDMIDSETESPEIGLQQPQKRQNATQKKQAQTDEDDIQRRSDLLGQIIKLAEQNGITMSELAEISNIDSINRLPTARLEKCVKFLETGQWQARKSKDDEMFAEAEKAGTAA